jgi:hypothetical protein
MKTDYDPFSEETFARVRAKQQSRRISTTYGQSNGEKTAAEKREPRKKRNIEFLQLDLVLLHKLRRKNARCIVWVMVYALSEAWFSSGVTTHHDNPFPLAKVDTKSWELSRSQKYRALQFLIQNGFIDIDRSDPKSPFVTLLWLPRQT